MRAALPHRVQGGADRQDVDILKGVVIGGLFLSHAASFGLISSVFRAALAALTGRALAAGLIHTPAQRGTTLWTLLYLLAVWIATFAPIALMGSLESIRSAAAAAIMVVLVRGLRAGSTFALACVLLATAAAAVGTQPHGGTLGGIEYAFGATWPRSWTDVAATAGWCVLGSAWAKASRFSR